MSNAAFKSDDIACLNCRHHDGFTAIISMRCCLPCKASSGHPLTSPAPALHKGRQQRLRSRGKRRCWHHAAEHPAGLSLHPAALTPSLLPTPALHPLKLHGTGVLLAAQGCCWQHPDNCSSNVFRVSQPHVTRLCLPLRAVKECAMRGTLDDGLHADPAAGQGGERSIRQRVWQPATGKGSGDPGRTGGCERERGGSGAGPDRAGQRADARLCVASQQAPHRAAVWQGRQPSAPHMAESGGTALSWQCLAPCSELAGHCHAPEGLHPACHSLKPASCPCSKCRHAM